MLLRPPRPSYKMELILVVNFASKMGNVVQHFSNAGFFIVLLSRYKVFQFGSFTSTSESHLNKDDL